MYRVFKQTGDGEFIFVTSRDELEQAVQVVETFNLQWPGEYVVRDLHGNNLCQTELGAIQPGPRQVSATRTDQR